MKKLLNFYKKLKPQTRFWLIFFVLVCLIWVPVRRNTGVEVYEPYRYDIDDVEEKQVIFACRLTGISAYSRQDDIWVIRKDGTCRLKNLVEGTESAKNNYVPEEWTDAELLKRMDEYMQDETLPEMDEKLTLDKDTVNYCINLSEINYENYTEVITDGSQDCKYYVVCGTGEDRHLKMLATEGDNISVCGDLKVFHAYDMIGKICRMIY